MPSLDEDLTAKEQEFAKRLAELNQRQRKVRLEGEVEIETKTTVSGQVEARGAQSGGQQETMDEGGRSGQQQPEQSRQEQPQQSRSQDEQQKPRESQEPQREDQGNQNQPEQQEPQQQSQEPRQKNEDEKPGKDENEKPKDGDEEKKPEGEGAEPAANPEAAEGLGKAGEGAAGAAEEAEAAEAGLVASEAGAAGGAAAGAAGGTAVAGGLAATFPIWGTILAIIGVILIAICVTIFIFVVMVAKCNEDSWTGVGARLLSTASSYMGIIPADVCDKLAINTGTSNNPNGSTTSSAFMDLPSTEWSSAHFGDGVGDYPRVKSAIYNSVQAVISNAQAQGLTVEVTSALRKSPPFAFSCHVLGEAVDIALSPPVSNPKNPSASDAKRIDALKSIGQNSGFGYVLDEYRYPSEQANGGHVHMQLTAGPCGSRVSETPPVTEYHMPQ